MNITFFGAAQNVTGSKHLVESNGFRVLLDCGLFQGRHHDIYTKNKTLPFDAKTINAVILSHSHADHCGMLPILVKEGFSGRIYCTPATRDITELILKDSARVQEQDCAYLNTHLEPGAEAIQPLYTEEDVDVAMRSFSPTPYFRESKEWTRLSPHVRFKLYDAGHILGSSVIVLETEEDGSRKTLLFTGDLGSRNVPILRNPEDIHDSIDVALSECTYGGHTHKPIREAVNEVEKVMRYAVKHRSKIIVPAFSLGRTQELIYMLHKLTDERQIPRIPIYVDSPLAGDLTDVYTKYSDEFNDTTWKDFGSKEEAPFFFKNLHYVKTVEESKKLNTSPGPLMIISASGMAEGGRIVHHLKHNIENPNNVVMFTGYQAEGTLGRKIIQGISPVRIHGETRDVRATIVTINELSAHADQEGLLEYLTQLKGLGNIYLVHTENPQAVAFTEKVNAKLPQVGIFLPHEGQIVKV